MAGPARSDESGEVVADGRMQRSARSRQRIVDALLELIQEGDLQPTAENVAARAGVGLRTVFRHFEDMESLYRELRSRVWELVRELVVAPVTEGALGERVDHLLRRRAAVFERIAPFQHSEVIQRWRSEFLADSHAAMVRELRSDLRRALPECREVPAPLAQALELVTSFEAWDRLRNEQGLGRERALEVMRNAVLSLLKRTDLGT